MNDVSQTHAAWTPDGETQPEPKPTEDVIIAAIAEVYDPEIPVNIYELGLIYTIDIGDNDLEACINRDTGAANATCLQRGEATVRKNLPEIARRLRAAAPRSARVIGLVDYDQFEAAKRLGFELFAGPFYASRHRARVRKVPVGEMGTLASLAAMQGGSATIEELEKVIDRDVGLSVKLLRYINSAYVGMRGSITSISVNCPRRPTAVSSASFKSLRVRTRSPWPPSEGAMSANRQSSRSLKRDSGWNARSISQLALLNSTTIGSSP